MEPLSQERLSEEDFKKLNYWMIDNLTDEGNEKWLLAFGEIKRLQAIEAERDELRKVIDRQHVQLDCYEKLFNGGVSTHE